MSTSKLVVSANAHVIAPYNRTRQGDRAVPRRTQDRDDRLWHRPTGGGQDVPQRIRVDLFDRHILEQKVGAALTFKNQVLTKIYNRRAIAAREVMDELLRYADRLAPMVADTAAARAGVERRVECPAGGRPGDLLDVDHGPIPM